MTASDMALAQGMRETRGALARWRDDPAGILGGWFAGALAFGAGLLVAVLVIASVVPPDLTPAWVPGIGFPADAGDYFAVIGRNGLVLALHAVACVAGFIAGSSLPLQASQMTGWRRWIHEQARPIAFGWVVGVTIFSLATQAFALGNMGAQLANQFAIPVPLLVLTVAPHALLELTAVFLPLAAWTIASRRGEWNELLAATVVTVGLALPMLAVASAWENLVWPELLQLASPVV